MPHSIGAGTKQPLEFRVWPRYDCGSGNDDDAEACGRPSVNLLVYPSWLEGKISLLVTIFLAGCCCPLWLSRKRISCLSLASRSRASVLCFVIWSGEEILTKHAFFPPR